MVKQASRSIAMGIAAILCMVTILAACSTSNKTATENPSPAQSSEAPASANSSQSSEEAPGSESWKKYKDEPVTLKMFFDHPSGATMNNMLFDKIKEDTGVTLEIEGSGDVEHSKLNLKIASDDLPDLIFTFAGTPQNRKMVEGGLVWSISELSSKYAPDVIDRMTDSMKKTLQLELDNKDIYAVLGSGDIPKGEENNPLIPKNTQVSAVTQEIYEALGSPSLQTPDDFINLLRQVKEKYPELIPVQPIRGAFKDQFGLPQVFNAFFPNFGLSENYFKGDNGYYSVIEHPNFVKLLQFINTLYKDGLMPKTEFTDSGETMFTNIQSGKVFAIGRDEAGNLAWHNSMITKVKQNHHYMAIEPFVEPGAQYAFDEFNGGTGGARMFISKKTKYPERAIAFLDYLKSKHTEFMIIFGPREGEDWIVDSDGYPRWTEQGQKISTEAANPDFKKIGMMSWTHMRNGIAALYLNRGPGELTEDQKKTQQYLAIAQKYYKDFSHITLAQMGVYPSGSEEEKISTTIKDYFGREVVKIAVGKPENVEAEYAKLIEKLKDMGLDKLNAFNTKQAENLDAKLKQFGY